MLTECSVNQLQVGLFEMMFADIDQASLYTPGAGHGHPPAWIAGHLTVTGESGVQLLGGTPAHPDWAPLFGMGSSDQIDPALGITKAQLAEAVPSAYDTLRAAYESAPAEVLDKPHPVSFFENTPIKTTGQLIFLLLTNHFGFHLAQLSSVRRQSGKPALF